MFLSFFLIFVSHVTRQCLSSVTIFPAVSHCLQCVMQGQISSRNLFSERSVFTSALRCLMSQSDSTNSVSFCYTTSNTSVFITNKWLLHYLLLCINSSTPLILMTNALYLYYFYNIASCLPSLTGEMHEATIPVTLQSLSMICSYFLPIVFRRSQPHSHSHVLVNLHPPL